MDLYIADDKKKNTNVASQPKNQPLQDEAPSDYPGSTIDITQAEPHLMASFHEKPEGITLVNQAADEEIILFIRRHYITNLSWQLATVAFIILPFIALAVLPYLPLPFTIPFNYLVITLLFYYLIVFGYSFTSFVVWFYNIGIISNKRLIDIDINSISAKDVAATSLKDILDIKYTQSGFKQNFFNYGDVHIETESIKPNFEFLNIPHPAKVTEMITTLAKEKRR